ncbi:sodium- and chloride-dependent glycine transporter 1 [Lingula anatina]|uniref:Transporter n=1 Tax=Lingula anatina TaxID=7574 RepID=A0A1S3HYL0_LINAN|nr:sodium- and chloride-dependent glycine transporter 1 [Lingula anatina]|eukprot:XP_013390656.1 sodium- and chloride-dependent glycine transporter 1 [Lingula anatina]
MQAENGKPTTVSSVSKELEAAADADMGRLDSQADLMASELNERGNWGGQIEFILTCVGYAVGLGNVWRFPYLCYRNGGGAFILPYCISLAFVGLPLFFMELCFGQFASLGPITIWKISPLFKGLGYAMVMVSLIMGLYYNVIIAYCIYYFFASMTANLPWSSCGNPWNTKDCLEVGQGVSTNTTNMTTTVSSAVTTTASSSMTTMLMNATNTSSRISPSEEYFYRKVLEMTDGIDNSGGLKWDLSLCLLLAWLIVFLVLIKGIQSLGKVVYFTAIFPYIILTILLVNGALLPGSAEGIRYYMSPNITRLADIEVWSDAVVQIFYSLSACSGGLVVMASYNKFNNNCFRDALIVPLINCGTSIYAGFVIFSVLGYMAHISGKEVADVASQGPGLAFIVYPEAISTMPLPTLWAILFFFMMMLLGFSSQFSIVECVLSSIMDDYAHILRVNKKREILMRGVACGLFFLLGLPMCTKSGHFLFDLVDTYIGGFPLLFVGLFECIVLQWVYGWDRFSEDVKMMLGKKPNIYFRIMWVYVSPFLMFAVIAFKFVLLKPHVYQGYIYPVWAQAMGWMIAFTPIALIPGWFLGRFCYDGGFQALKSSASPQADWGPANAEDREGSKYDTKSKAKALYGNGSSNPAFDQYSYE